MLTFEAFIPLLLIFFILMYFIFIRKYEKKAREKAKREGKKHTTSEKIVAILFVMGIVYVSATDESISAKYREIFTDPDLWKVSVALGVIIIMVWLYRKTKYKMKRKN